MKNSIFLRTAFVAVMAVGFSVQAQMPGGNQAGLNAAMLKLFGTTTAFTSKASVRMLDKAQAETMSMTMDFAMLDGKVRAEIDLSQIKSKEMPPEAAASLKAMGMDKMVSVVLPEKKNTLVIYPSLRSYAEVPMSKDDASTMDTKYKIETTKLGTETLDGHACVKNKVLVTGEKGDKHEAVVWNATDMKDFPLQMQMNQNEATVVMRYSNVQLVRPDAKQFEAPTGFTKHASVEQMMQGAMLKMLGGK